MDFADAVVIVNACVCRVTVNGVGLRFLGTKRNELVATYDVFTFLLRRWSCFLYAGFLLILACVSFSVLTYRL